MATATHQQPELDTDITKGLDLGPVAPLARRPELRKSKFFAEYLNRLVTGRDMHVLVTAGGETGVGKTTLAVVLALIMDQHGWHAGKAAVANPDHYSVLYDKVAPGSVLILDEAEKAADSRRGMTKESVNLTQDFATKRYQQVFGILTAPTKSWVDKRLGDDAVDYWIQAQETDMGRIKGEGRTFRLKVNEHAGQSYETYYETIHWPALDWHDSFNELDERKTQILESDEESPYIHRDEYEEQIQTVRKETRKEYRNQIIEKMVDSGYKQTEVADVLDVSQATVSNIVRGK